MLSRCDLPINERIFQGLKYKFLVTGREDIKTFISETPYIIISITDPENQDAEIPESESLIDTLRLKFHDIGRPSRFEALSSDISMTSEQAEQIWTFVEKNLSNVKLIVCQCEQGVSRSAAIAAALSRILQNEDEYFFKYYWSNRWVYDLLIQTKQEIQK